MITFKLYSREWPHGEVIAKVAGESQAIVLQAYYKRIYNNERFRVTRRNPRARKEIYITGGWK
jgi:hypothetical protein